MTDALAAARAVLADRHKLFTISTLQITAICEALDRLDREPEPAISTGLAEAARAAIDAFRAADARGLLADYGELLTAFHEAFRAFSTAFEQEFPNV